MAMKSAPNVGAIGIYNALEVTHAQSGDGHANCKAEAPVRLKRRLGLVHAVAVICGTTIGSGIYITPQKVLHWAGSPGEMLVLWGIGGVYSMIGALVYAELGTTFPQSGSRYHYLEQMYGPFVAFLEMVMMNAFNRPSANAIKCLVFSSYVLQPAFPDCLLTESGRRLVAVSMIGPLLYLNIINVKWSATLQTFLTSISVLALTTIAATGLFYMGTGDTDHWQNPFDGSSTEPGGITFALYSVIFSFSGWFALNCLVEELKDPYRNIPRAFMISMFLMVVLYMLVNVAYVAVLGKEGMVAVDAIAVAFARKALGWQADHAVIVALNMVSSYNTGSIITSRLGFAGARKGHLPEMMSYISVKYSTPIFALIVQAALTVPLVLWFDMFGLMNNMMAASKVFDMLLLVGLIRHRYQQPEFHRPVKMPILIIIADLVASIALFIIPMVTRPKESIFGALTIISIGVPCYLVFVIWKNKPPGFLRAIIAGLYNYMALAPGPFVERARQIQKARDRLCAPENI